jgi:uncharacterized protein (DUF934 family)
MTRDEAAAALERLVESRGPDWAANTWGIARDRLAGWLEGSEDLPDWMVTVMQVWTSAQREKAGDVGCFEDADDHPPEVPEDVTETGLDAVSIPTVGRGEALWDAYRLEKRQFHETGLRDLEDYAWQAAGEQCDIIEALEAFEFLPEIIPVDSWDKDLNWQGLIRALADVVRSAIEEDDR